MKVLRSFVATLVLAGAGWSGVASGGAAGTRSGSLVLAGTGTSYVDVTFRTPVGVAPFRLAVNGDAGGWSFRGCGGLRGFYLRPVTGDGLGGVGAVDFAGLRFGAATDTPLPGNPLIRFPVPLNRRLLDLKQAQDPPTNTVITLKPGRYRAYLIGEGTCEVSVPLTGTDRVVRMAATRTVPMQFAVDQLDTPAPHETPAVPVPRVGAVQHPLRVTGTTLALALVHQIGYSVNAGPIGVIGWETCIEADQAPLCERPPPNPPTYTGEYHRSQLATQPPVTSAVPLPVDWPVAANAFEIGLWWEPGALATGTLTGKIVAESVPSTRVQGVLFALDLR